MVPYCTLALIYVVIRTNYRALTVLEPWQANRAAAFRGKKALVLPAKTLPIALVARKTARLGMTPKEKAHRVKVAVKRRESQWRVSRLESGSDIPNTGNRARESSEEIVEKPTHPLQALRYV